MSTLGRALTPFRSSPLVQTRGLGSAGSAMGFGWVLVPCLMVPGIDGDLIGGVGETLLQLVGSSLGVHTLHITRLFSLIALGALKNGNFAQTVLLRQ